MAIEYGDVGMGGRSWSRKSVSRRSFSERLEGLLGVTGRCCDWDSMGDDVGCCGLGWWIGIRVSNKRESGGRCAVAIAGVSRSVGGWDEMRSGEGVPGLLGNGLKRECLLADGV